MNLRSLLIVNDFGGEYKRIDSTQSHRIGPTRGEEDRELKRYTSGLESRESQRVIPRSNPANLIS